SDTKRVQQVLRNLLSNAFKFTSEGSVKLHIGLASHGWTRDHEILGRADKVVSFAVKDTGIGISPAKYQVIFEPFQQADTSTSRKYGGTGLGLSISREVAKLLGGEIKLESTPARAAPLRFICPTVTSRCGLRRLKRQLSLRCAKFRAKSRSQLWPVRPSWNSLPPKCKMIAKTCNLETRPYSSWRTISPLRACCLILRASRASRVCWPLRARRLLPWPGSSGRRPFRSTYGCPTWRATLFSTTLS